MDDQKSWLRNHFQSWYLWAGLTPGPAPETIATVGDYFQSQLFKGNDTLPADRYSGYTSTENFLRYFGEGKTLGFGLAVAGFEVSGRPNLPLRVRHVDPESPAAAAGLRRGDRIWSLNGHSASEKVSQGDYSDLNAPDEGTPLTLEYARDGLTRTVQLRAALYPVKPVPQHQIIEMSATQRAGYVQVQSMLGQATEVLATAFDNFKSTGIEELVLDLRYNGGGYVSVGANLASRAAGAPANGKVYAQLNFSAAKSSYNHHYMFENPQDWNGLRRVYVLTGPRTCSASEQVINGLRGAGVEVVTIGATTCGKPVGFTPRSYCGNTYSVVSFASVNALGEGRYYNGFVPTCPADDDLDRPLGDPQERLLQTALAHARNGQCPARPLSLRASEVIVQQPLHVEPGQWQGMWWQ